MALKDLFRAKPVIGVVHLLPLPGAPNYRNNLTEVIDRAVEDALALEEGGVDAIIVENFGDRPLRMKALPITISSMTKIVERVIESTSIPVGINVLRSDGLAALSIAYVTGASFIRVNAYTEIVASGEGLLKPEAWEIYFLKNYLKSDVLILADIKVKHGVSLSAVDYYHAALEAMERGLADAVIVTGLSTGEPPPTSAIKEAKEAGATVLVGSGITSSNIRDYVNIADGFIIGTYFHREGKYTEPIDVKRVRDIVEQLSAN